MSQHTTNSIELQRLVGTFDRSMSVPDHSGTVVGETPPIYHSVEVAQKEAQDFKNQQSQEDYTHTGPLDPLNEYDVVTEKQRENTSPGYIHHQSNILYADQFAAQEMKHATLTRSDQHKYSGPTSEESLKEIREGYCGCSNFCLWFIVILVFTFVALLAIVAVVMVVLVIVQVIPVCNCAASPEEVQILRNMVESLTAAQQSTSLNVSDLTQQLNSLNVTPAIESAISERITTDGTILGVNFSAVLMDFEPYSDCISQVERSCEVQSNHLCETPDADYIPQSTSMLAEYTYLKDARCTRSPESTDTNILVTSLVIDRVNTSNVIYCLCYRQDRGVISGLLQCELETTRCRPTRNVPVSIVTTSSASRSRN